MDIRLLGCACISLASISFLVFDYLTYVPTSQTIATLSNPMTSERSEEPFITQKTHQQIAVIPASVTKSSRILKTAPVEAPVEAPTEAEATAEVATAQQSAERALKPRLKNFGKSYFSSLLSPNGFSRPNWKPQSSRHDKTPIEKERFTVMLDPGHGGSDPGAKSFNGLLEKHLTLDIARRTRLYLSKYPNIDVIFTREIDEGLSRDARVQRIKESDADLLVSLHFNDLPQTDVALVETFFASRQNIQESLSKLNDNGALPKRHNLNIKLSRSDSLSFTHSSRQLANILQQHVFNEVSLKNQNVENAGVKNDTLFVLTRSYKPSALIEMTCLSNPSEAMKLATNNYRNQLSEALAKGILEYRKSTIDSHTTNPEDSNESPSLVRSLPETNRSKRNIGESV